MKEVFRSSIQAGTPGFRLLSSYELGLPGGARNNRVGLIQQEYYNTEQKRIVTALENLGYEVKLTQGPFTARCYSNRKAEKWAIGVA